jgi:hypothetical protein
MRASAIERISFLFRLFAVLASEIASLLLARLASGSAQQISPSR